MIFVYNDVSWGFSKCEVWISNSTTISIDNGDQFQPFNEKDLRISY
jgi:hypothetical protein